LKTVKVLRVAIPENYVQVEVSNGDFWNAVIGVNPEVENALLFEDEKHLVYIDTELSLAIFARKETEPNP